MKNIIEERDEGIIKRQKFKRQFDNAITLSNRDGIRLIDEGAVVTGDDYVRFVIAKGAVEKYLNGQNEYLANIDSDYTGYINYGHSDFYADPFSLVGSWTLSDLSPVDIGGGRQGIDVDMKLWDWHPFVQMLPKLPYTVGISAEFWGHVNESMSETIGEIVYDEICITDFAIVGNGANVNSNGLTLKGENMNKKEQERLQAALDDMNNLLDEEVAEETTEEQVEETVSEVEETVEEVIENAEEEAEETEEETEETAEEESEMLSQVLATVGELTKAVKELREENAELRDALSIRESELSEKKDEIDAFMEKFQTLSVGVNPNFADKKEVKEELSADRYDGHNDGIGV